MSEAPANKEQVLSGEILADARRQAERSVKRAHEESRKVAEAILSKARAESEAELKEAELRVARERQIHEAGLLLEERMRRLRVQGQLLDDVFGQGSDQLSKRAGFDYAAVLTRLAVEAVLAMHGDAFVLKLGKDDLAAFKGLLPGAVSAAVRERSGRNVKITVSDRADVIAGGVRAESIDGRQRVDNSLAGRLRRMEDELRFEVADILFGKAVEAAAPAQASGDRKETTP